MSEAPVFCPDCGSQAASVTSYGCRGGRLAGPVPCGLAHLAATWPRSAVAADEAAEAAAARRNPPLCADPAITCPVLLGPEDGDNLACGVMSRFVVERSDGDKSFGWDGKHEACEAHLADVVTGMVDGADQVHAVVAIRWDAAVLP